MVLIALSWIIILFYFIPSGIAIKSIFKLKEAGNYIPIFLGLFVQCLALTICSFFFSIGIEVFIANSLIILGLIYWKSKEIADHIKAICSDFLNLSIISKFGFLTLFVFSLFKCSQYPFIVDNESYYIQTIKWINEYGLVKGLGNLHIYLGQTSAFHILQAGFNFNFITDRSNDINGLILNLSSLYFITEFEKRNKINGEIHWIGLLLFFNILFFQFISSPSPDLIVIVLSQILFYYFMDKEDSFENSKIAVLLFLNLLLIKVTIAPLVLIIFYQIFSYRSRINFFIIATAIVVTVLCLKNSIVSGYPLYPLRIFPLDNDWTIPEKMLEFVIQITQNSGYFKTEVIKNASTIDKINSWLHQTGINRIFNWGILLLLALAPFVKLFKNRKKYFFLYGVLALNFLTLLFTSPQYRYFLPVFVFLFLIVISALCTNLHLKIKTLQWALLISTVLPILFTEILHYPNLSKNQLHQEKEINDWTQLVHPKKCSKFNEMEFNIIVDGNLNYYSPKENFFFYGTANGKLPCVNKVQIEYLKKKYLFKPQMRTTALKDGFYSKTLSPNE